jgi:energy-coupling factor transport system ATP-binding protein
MEEAARADRVIVINDGSVALDGTAREVFSHVDRLHSMGLESPQGVELVRRLRDCGLDIDTDVLTAEECESALAILLKGGSK